jgi:hypothetical protein
MLKDVHLLTEAVDEAQAAVNGMPPEVHERRPALRRS